MGIIEGRGPAALAVGAGGFCLTVLFLYDLLFLPSFSLSLKDGPIKTEILSQRAVNPKITNQLKPLRILKIVLSTDIIL